MKKYLNIILIVVFSALIVASALIIVLARPAEPQIIEPETPDPIIKEIIVPPTSGLVIVDTPAQTEPGPPAGF